MRRCLTALCAALLLSGCLSLPRPSPAPPAASDQAPAADVPSYVVFGQRYYPMAEATGYRERGVASWYGKKFHGLDTANGERYDMYAMTAAHKTLPLPTWVRVTNLRNGASIVVRVNDRGPFAKNRLIDLSYEAARRIDMIGDGTTLVEVEAIPPPAPASVTATAASAPAEPVYRPDPQTAGHSEAQIIESLDYETGPATPAERALPRSAADDRPGIGQVFVQVGAFGDFANAQRMREALYNAAIENVRLANAESNGLPIFRVQVGPVIDVAEYDVLIARLESLGISETHLITE